MGAVNLLLDTCTFLWLAADPQKLSAHAVELINDPDNLLFLNEISIWEMVMKYQAGRLPLPESPRAWISKQSTYFQISHQVVTSEAIYLSGELPPIHRDPFDRLLAAQSMVQGMTVITPDKPFKKLGCDTRW
jgi:PIN domain nuclease of toxin-antitoxin system